MIGKVACYSIRYYRHGMDERWKKKDRNIKEMGAVSIIYSTNVNETKAMIGKNGNEKDIDGEKHSVSRHQCVNYFQKGAL